MVLKCYFKVRINTTIVSIKLRTGYLQVNRINLCKNVIRAVDANKDDLPPITAYPISAQVSPT
jgi:hypothetical protein